MTSQVVKSSALVQPLFIQVALTVNADCVMSHGILILVEYCSSGTDRPRDGAMVSPSFLRQGIYVPSIFARSSLSASGYAWIGSQPLTTGIG